MPMPRPRVAIAHDYLTQRGGAEKVVLSMARAFPDAPIHTMLYEPETTFEEFRALDVRVSSINRFAMLRRHHRLALPILPWVAESISIDADLVVMSTSGWAHGFTTTGRTLVYCYSPARWLYARDLYLRDHGDPLKRTGLAMTGWYLRAWDQRKARGHDRYLCTSALIRERIADAYSLKSEILPCPTTMDAGGACEPIEEVADWAEGDGFYLCIARLLPYKNVDAVIEAFRGSGRRLVIVGRGPEEARLRRLSRGDEVRLLADLPHRQIAWAYRECRALVAASHEDYGLTPLEAGIWGRPTVALRWGGYLETVREGVTGIFFDEPTPRQIEEAVGRSERVAWDPEAISAHSRLFGEQRFVDALREEAEALLGDHPA